MIIKYSKFDHFIYTFKRQWYHFTDTLKLLTLPALVATALIFGQWHLTMKDLNLSTQSIQTQKESSLSIKDYVMSESRKAGIDEYKVYMIIQAESKWNPEATLINKGGSLGIDRGLFQINSKFHPEVSNSCAYDYKCSTKEAIRIIKKHGFKEWTTGVQLGLGK